MGWQAAEATAITQRLRTHNIALADHPYQHYTDRAKFIAVAREERNQFAEQMDKERRQSAALMRLPTSRIQIKIGSIAYSSSVNSSLFDSYLMGKRRALVHKVTLHRTPFKASPAAPRVTGQLTTMSVTSKTTSFLSSAASSCSSDFSSRRTA
jgi:hypothetical protein